MCKRVEQNGVLRVREGPEGACVHVLRGYIPTLSLLGRLET